MDNSENLFIKNSASASPENLNKRRSLVFKRKSIVPEDEDFDSTDFTDDIKHELKKIKLDDEFIEFDIRKYIGSLKAEDKEWRELYSKRKAFAQDSTKRSKIHQQIGQALDISYLLDSERAFLAARPDYEEFNKNIFQLHAMATKVMFLHLSSEHFYKNSLTKLQHNTDDAVNRIINLTD